MSGATARGRKDRATPLRGDSAKALAQWLPERAGAPHEPLFASNRKRRFSRDGIERIVRKYARLASATCPSLGKRANQDVLALVASGWWRVVRVMSESGGQGVVGEP